MNNRLQIQTEIPSNCYAVFCIGDDRYPRAQPAIKKFETNCRDSRTTSQIYYERATWKKIALACIHTKYNGNVPANVLSIFDI